MDIEKSIGQTRVVFRCDHCKNQAAATTIWFEVFKDEAGKADLERLANDVKNYELLCVNCGGILFSADIKISNAIQNH